MTVDTRPESDLQDDFRRRAILMQFALIALGGAVFFTSKNGAPLMYGGLTN